MDKIKVFEAFSGYGSQSIALRNLGVDYDVVAISEIDKYAIKAYEAIHGKVNNLGDISKINVEDIPKHDLFTYSFPCQDLSVAGKQQGLVRGKTRSGLLYECERIIEHCKPKYLLLENVKNLVGKKHIEDFNEWLKYLESLGYTNYWKVLNAKHYGVPQNRERVFVVSILGEHKPYVFPKAIKLNKAIKDILEDEVDEKYYINKPFNLVTKGHQAEIDMKGMDCIKRAYSVDKVSPTLTTMGGGHREPKILCEKINQYVEIRKYKVDIEDLKKELKECKNNKNLTVKQISELLEIDKTTVEHWFRNDSCFSIPSGDIWMQLKEIIGIGTDKFDKSIMEFEFKLNEFDQSNRVYRQEGISPTITCDNEGSAKKVMLPCICASRGRNPENPSDRTVGSPTEQRIEINKNGTSNTITTVQKDKYAIQEDFRIRKLTPRECFRLMGMNEVDIDKIQQADISNSQQYKMAGNSIVVNVLEGIFKNLFGV